MVFAAESRLSGQLSGFRPLFQPGLIRRYTSKCMLDRRPAEIRRHLRKTKVKIKPGSIFLRRVYHMLCSIKTLFCLRDLPQFFPYLHIDLCQVTDCLTIGFHCQTERDIRFSYLRTITGYCPHLLPPFPQKQTFLNRPLYSEFSLFFFLLAFDIGRYLLTAPVTDGHGTIRRVPQVSFPQFFFQLRMYKEHLTCKIPFHDLDHI